MQNSRQIKHHITRFLHIIDGNQAGKDYCILYNSLSLGTVIAHKVFANRIKVLSKSDGFYVKELINGIDRDEDLNLLLSECKKHKLILDASETEYKDYILARNVLDRTKIGILYLLVTDKCNCACRYCFMGHSQPKHNFSKQMTKETAKRAITLFSHVLQKEKIDAPMIVFFGGEPTLNFKVIDKALRIIKNSVEEGLLPINTRKVLNTNGTLINKYIADYLKKNDVSVSLSLDGPSHIHNSERIYPSGHGTYIDALSGYKKLNDAGVNTFVSCTIGPHNVGQMEDIATWLINTLAVKSFSYNFLIECDRFSSQAMLKYAHAAADGLIRSYEICREKGVYEDRIMRRVKAFVNGYFQYTDCGACGQQIVVDPHSNFGVCHALTGNKDFFVENVADSDLAKDVPWKEWRLRSPFTMRQCLDCVALGICGGGCPYNALKQKGSIWDLDDVNCIITKRVTHFLLKELLNAKTLATNKECL